MAMQQQTMEQSLINAIQKHIEASRELEKRCAQKCMGGFITIHRCDDGRWMVSNNNEVIAQKADTLEMAIALFAKRLFSHESEGK
jgi:hypothetical protein